MKSIFPKSKNCFIDFRLTIGFTRVGDRINVRIAAQIFFKITIASNAQIVCPWNARYTPVKTAIEVLITFIKASFLKCNNFYM